MSDLPPWLQDDDEEKKDSGSLGVTGNLPWLSGVSDENDDAPQQSNDPLKGMTGALPWNEQAGGGVREDAGEADFASWLDSDDAAGDQASDDFEFEASEGLPDWLGESGGVADETAEEALNWMEDDTSAAFDFGSEPEPSSVGNQAADMPGTGELPDWLSNTSAEPSSGFEFEAEAEPASGFDFGSETEADEDLPSWLSNPNAEPEPTYEAPEETFEAAYNYEDELDEVLSEPSPWGAAQDDGFTYDDWERQQQEADEVATQPPAPDLPMPDFFANLDDEAAAPATDTGGLGGDYVPEWFMGVEELSDEDAPDWFKPPTSNPLAAPPPPQPAAPELDMPDFDDLMASGAPPDAPQIQRLAPEEPQIKRLAPEEPQIKRLEPLDTGTTPAADDPADWLLEDQSTADDFESMFGESAPAASSPQDDFANLFGADASTDLGGDAPLMAGLDDLAPPDDFGDLFDADVSTDLGGDAPLMAGLDDLAPPDDFGDLFDADASTDLGGDSPAWLQGYDSEAALADLPAAPDFSSEAPSSDAPDWFGDVNFDDMTDLSALAEPQGIPAAPQQQEPADVFAGLDDILAGDVPDLPSSDVNLDALGGDLGFDDSFLSGFEAPAPVDDAPPGIEVVPGDLPAPNIALSEVQPVPDVELAESEALPEWMRQQIGTVSGDEYLLNVSGVQARFEQIQHIVLPQDMRQLRERALNYLTQTSVSQGNAINTGPLQGIQGGLTLEPTVPGDLKLGRAYDVTSTQEIRVSSLRSILEIVQQENAAQRIQIRYDLDSEDEADPLLTVPPPPPRRRTRIKVGRLLITLLLLAAVIVPFLSESLHLAEDIPDELPDDAAILPVVIDALGALDDSATREAEFDARVEQLQNFVSPLMPLDEDVIAESRADLRNPPRVLVAFEYSSTASAELTPLAEAVIRDILANGGKPVTIGTNPIGVLQAESLMTRLAQDEALQEAMGISGTLEPIRDYVVLRYIGESSIGVRSLASEDGFSSSIFARDIAGRETNLDVGELDTQDFLFVIVIGERAEDLRVWAEQFTEVDIPKVALVTAAAEPAMRPYLSSEAYGALLVGIEDAVTYNRVRNENNRTAYDGSLPDPETSQWHSTALAALVATLLILLGALFNMIRTLRRRNA